MDSEDSASIQLPHGLSLATQRRRSFLVRQAVTRPIKPSDVCPCLCYLYLETLGFSRFQDHVPETHSGSPLAKLLDRTELLALEIKHGWQQEEL